MCMMWWSLAQWCMSMPAVGKLVAGKSVADILVAGKLVVACRPEPVEAYKLAVVVEQNTAAG